MFLEGVAIIASAARRARSDHAAIERAGGQAAQNLLRFSIAILARISHGLAT
jgi:hypothetical protein